MERAMMIIKRSWWWFGIACLAAIVLSLAPLSRLAIHPITVSVSGEVVTIHRAFPSDTFGLPRPQLSYIETVKGLSVGHNDGHICLDASGPFRYTTKEQVGSWSIPWAADCLDDPRGYVWEACWMWHLGAIRLSPVCAQYTKIRAIEGAE
jgi:hypothetical protein